MSWLNIAKLNRLWVILLFSNVLCLVFLTFLYSGLNEERTAAVARGDIFALGYQLGKYSDFLTTEAQSFAVTGNVKHLFNYWKEVEVEQNREKIVRKLKEFGVADQESHLLIESKRNSDELIQTEIRSMRLVLSAYAIPEELYPDGVNNFHLQPKDDALSPEEKVRLAQTIMFDENYRLNKERIMGPLNSFNEKIAQNIQLAILQKREKTNWVLFILIIIFALNSIVVTGTIWLKKDFLTSSNN